MWKDAAEGARKAAETYQGRADPGGVIRTFAEDAAWDFFKNKAPIIGPLTKSVYDLSNDITQTLALEQGSAKTNEEIAARVEALSKALDAAVAEYDNLSRSMNAAEAFKEKMDSLCGANRQCQDKVASASSGTGSRRESLELLGWVRENCSEDDYKRAVSAIAGGTLQGAMARQRRMLAASSASASAALTEVNREALSDFAAAQLRALQSRASLGQGAGSGSKGCAAANDDAERQLRALGNSTNACSAARNEARGAEIALQAIGRCAEMDPGGEVRRQLEAQRQSALNAANAVCAGR